MAIIQALLKLKFYILIKKMLRFLIQKDIFWLGLAKRISDLAFLDAKQRLDELFLYTGRTLYQSFEKVT